MNAIYVLFDVESGEILSLHETYVKAFKEKELLKKQERKKYWDSTPSEGYYVEKVYVVEELRVGNKWQGAPKLQKPIEEVPF